tara:strand:+ start:5174 stop:5449 length:276 start_codon:yes stop_codon:yes gene_type:complete
MANNHDAYDIITSLAEVIKGMRQHFDLQNMEATNVRFEIDFNTSERFEFIYDAQAGMPGPEVLIRKLEQSQLVDYQYTNDQMGEPITRQIQ